MDDHLNMSELFARALQTTKDESVRPIFERISELHRLLHAEEQKLTNWMKSRDAASRAGLLYKGTLD
jgi:hypothetical protein